MVDEEALPCTVTQLLTFLGANVTKLFLLWFEQTLIFH